jgi:16S rRNA (adenine(1408)-N(1))-methyltransferase
VIVDVGTGDGRAVLDAARRDLAALVVGIDADAVAMRAASRAASRSASRGGLPNALFIATGAELIPATAQGLADELLVTLPGSRCHRPAAGEPRW